MKHYLTFITLFSATLIAHAELTEEQKRISLEVEPSDPNAVKIVLLAGSPSNKAGQHEYFAGCALIAEWLKQTPGTWPVLVADGWPRNEQVLENARSVVVYADGGAKLPFLEPQRWEKMRKLMDAGSGLVMLHQAVDVPEAQAEEVKGWLGGVWQKDIGSRGHWDMEFREFPKHPTTSGMTPFAAPFDGWLFNLHFAPGIVPVVRGAVPDSARTTPDAKAHAGRAETIGWIHERKNGGRSFGFTGCDLHRNWIAESQRRLVTNAILWTAKVAVPESGAPVAMLPAQLAVNLDAKTPAKKTQALQ